MVKVVFFEDSLAKSDLRTCTANDSTAHKTMDHAPQDLGELGGDRLGQQQGNRIGKG